MKASEIINCITSLEATENMVADMDNVQYFHEGILIDVYYQIDEYGPLSDEIIAAILSRFDGVEPVKTSSEISEAH